MSVHHGRIVQLDEAVINRIAAGEVVVRPANALKELLENSLDAGSQKISVVVKGGGLKMLRIEDNGHGIREEDLPLLCERFTTSKLRKYEDLTSIQTFGFRGEALASISHVAHVTVTTMTKDAVCAKYAEYSDGKLVGAPKSLAGTTGTTLVAEDMFYNNATRRQALGKDSIEHGKVLEVVQRYALHNPSVAFSLKKATSNTSELHTPGSSLNTCSSRDVAGILYGHGLSRELFDIDLRCEELKFQCRGLASGPNWTMRSMTLILFINNRLVECSSLKKALEAVYSTVLPRHQHPWVYLSLELDPATIDVNVHPTKMEVQFLHEPLIAERVQETLAAKLRDRGGCKSFDTKLPLPSCPKPSAVVSAPAVATTIEESPQIPPQALGPAEGGDVAAFAGPALEQLAAAGGEARLGDEFVVAVTNEDLAGGSGGEKGRGKGGGERAAQTGAPRKEAEPTRVRTDHAQRSLESVWRSRTFSQYSIAESTPGSLEDSPPPGDTDEAVVEQPPAVHEAGPSRIAHKEAQELTSICELKQVVKLHGSAELSKRMRSSVYVGPVNRELVLLQSGSALRLVNLRACAQELAYQRLLRGFGWMNMFVLQSPLPLKKLLEMGVHDPESGYDLLQHGHISVNGLVNQFSAILEERAEMLWEYLSFHIEEGKVTALPNPLTQGPDSVVLDKLPLFLIQLCAEVDWDEEKPCFDGLCRLWAEFCVEMALPSEDEEAEADMSPKTRRAHLAEAASAAAGAGEGLDVAEAAMLVQKKRARIGQHKPLEKMRFLHEALCQDTEALWPSDLERDGFMLDLVSLEQLYKIFERC